MVVVWFASLDLAPAAECPTVGTRKGVPYPNTPATQFLQKCIPVFGEPLAVIARGDHAVRVVHAVL
jgi:hypothetical protein